MDPKTESKETNQESEDQEKENSDFEEEEEEEERTDDLFQDDPEWKDLTPIPDPEDPKLPLYVQHSKRYDDHMGYFRALLEKGEFSMRGKQLAKKILYDNPSNITATWYIISVNEKLGYDFEEEFLFNEDMLNEFYKSYQAFFHRRWLVSRESESSENWTSIEDRINVDKKNFHIWTYSMWYARKFGTYKEVYDISTHFLEYKATNNSAWNCRRQMAAKAGANMSEEIDYAFSKMEKFLDAESPCSYIRYIATDFPELRAKIIEKSNQFVESHPDSRHGIALLLHVLQICGDNSRNDELYDRLIVTDPIRSTFWKLVKSGDPKYN